VASHLLETIIKKGSPNFIYPHKYYFISLNSFPF
jgi:hypothetical protein